MRRVDHNESARLVSCFFAGLSACLIVVSTGAGVEVGEASPVRVELSGVEDSSTASFFICLASQAACALSFCSLSDFLPMVGGQDSWGEILMPTAI